MFLITNMFTMKTIKILFSLVVFVMMGLTVSAQAKKDTTVIFKVGIHFPVITSENFTLFFYYKNDLD